MKEVNNGDLNDIHKLVHEALYKGGGVQAGQTPLYSINTDANGDVTEVNLAKRVGDHPRNIITKLLEKVSPTKKIEVGVLDK
jgi:hypothetical protein